MAVRSSSGMRADVLPVLNGWCIAGTLQALSALFIARFAHARRSQLPEAEALGLQLLIFWGLAFWFRATFGEVRALASSEYQRGVQMFVLGATALALETSGRKLDWLPGRVPSLLLWPSMLVYLSLYAWQDDTHPLARAGSLGWPVIALGMFFVLRHLVEEQIAQLRALHALSVWSWTWWAVVLLEHAGVNTLDASFRAGLANALIAAAMLLVLRLARGSRWPFGAHKQHTLQITLLGLALYGGLRSLWSSATLPGSGAPLPYVPIVNPLDLSALLGLLALVAWLRRLGQEGLANAEQRFVGYVLATALGFAWWNALLARSVHHYAGVAFDYEALFASSALQLACSLSWTLIALSVMVIAHRTRVRAPWLGAAALLAVVVGKLFLLDLEHLSTPTKIVSFLGVGALLLLVGYIAPVPPKLASESPP